MRAARLRERERSNGPEAERARPRRDEVEKTPTARTEATFSASFFTLVSFARLSSVAGACVRVFSMRAYAFLVSCLGKIKRAIGRRGFPPRESSGYGNTTEPLLGFYRERGAMMMMMNGPSCVCAPWLRIVLPPFFF